MRSPCVKIDVEGRRKEQISIDRRGVLPCGHRLQRSTRKNWASIDVVFFIRALSPRSPQWFRGFLLGTHPSTSCSSKSSQWSSILSFLLVARAFFVSKIFVTTTFTVVPGFPAWYSSHDILLFKVLAAVFNPGYQGPHSGLQSSSPSSLFQGLHGGSGVSCLAPAPRYPAHQGPQSGLQFVPRGTHPTRPLSSRSSSPRPSRWFRSFLLGAHLAHQGPPRRGLIPNVLRLQDLCHQGLRSGPRVSCLVLIPRHLAHQGPHYGLQWILRGTRPRRSLSPRSLSTRPSRPLEVDDKSTDYGSVCPMTAFPTDWPSRRLVLLTCLRADSSY